MSRIELLSPAGTKDALIAAVNAGADAVYLGGSKFSARAYAGNFTEEELEETIDYCNVRDVKVYLAVNTLIKDSEIEEFMQYIEMLYRMGVSALILQDTGLVSLVREYFPDMELHASTQMTMNTVEDAEFLLSLGISRAVASRELSISEITTIKQATGIEIEAFVHGALCLCYSGKCYFSSMNGGRSGNRGACAQPCREEYQSSINGAGKYFLSPKDLNTIEHLEEIVHSGVDSLKIEGRMKRTEYVSLVTKSYRQALDAVLQGEKINLKKLNEDLSKVFNRSFTKGYLLHQQGESIINTAFQKPKGTKAAKVIGWDKKTKRLKIKLLDDLRKGDGLTTREAVGRILKGKTVTDHALAGEVVELDCILDIKKDTILYKTYDYGFMSVVEEEMKKEKRLPIRLYTSLKKGQPPYIRCVMLPVDKVAGDIFQAEITLEEPIEEAANVALSREKVQAQLSKVGEYPLEIEELTIEMDEDIHLPAKVLNLLRREVLEKVMKAKICSFKRQIRPDKTFIIDSLSKQEKKSAALSEMKVSVKIRSAEQLEALCQLAEGKIDRVYTDQKHLYQQMKEKNLPFQPVLCLPSVIKENDREGWEKLLEGVEGFMTANMGLSWKYKESCLIADYPLNLYNSVSHQFYHRMGIETTMSIETIYSEHDSYLFLDSKDMVEIPVYLYPALMTTEYCPYKGENGKCKEASCKLSDTFITNKKGESFQFRREIGCKSVIYPQSPKSMKKDRMEGFMKEGYHRFRIEFLNENKEQVKQIIHQFL